MRDAPVTVTVTIKHVEWLRQLFEAAVDGEPIRLPGVVVVDGVDDVMIWGAPTEDADDDQ